MIKTLFVVGAGASSEVGLPLGGTLKAVVANLLRGAKSREAPLGIDMLIYDAMNAAERDDLFSVADLQRAAEAIADGLRTGYSASIDDYIHSQSETNDHAALELCAKLAIVRAILKAEHDSSLLGHNKNAPPLRTSWLASFFEWLIRGCSGATELERRLSQIGFVIFNYDRCVEYFLDREIRRIFPVANVPSILRNVQFFHPYGVVGGIRGGLSGGIATFGNDPLANDLLNLTKKVKTYNESMNKEHASMIQDAVCETESLVFLGFAFHTQNMNLLLPFPAKTRFENLRQIVGTADGIPHVGAAKIEGDLSRRTGFHEQLNIDHQVKCSELFRKYQYHLTFG